MQRLAQEIYEREYKGHAIKRQVPLLIKVCYLSPEFADFFRIMNRKSTLWVFLVLFAFTGQLLAAPFLDCPQLRAMAAQELGVDCLFMDMDMAAGTQQMADAESQHEGLKHSDSPMTDCYLCLHCPAGISPMQISAVLLVVQGQSLTPDTFIPPSHLDGLFRPPISA